MDDRIAAEGKAKGDVLQAQAAAREKEISLSWTDIIAPIDGRIGPARVTPGNLVGPDTGVLATIVSSDPVYVTFPVTQRELLAFADRRAEAEFKPSLVLATGQVYPLPGKIALLDVEANQTTDSVTVRAEFPNPNGTLVDGASVRVVVDIGLPVKQVTIPQSAIAIDQQGPFVLVVGAGDKVEVRRVELGQYRNGLAVVLKGISAGDRVIVEGQQRARPGETVTPAVLPSAIRS
jgi:membrane fusion protein (multidrug efflux system)